ncbi:tudor domain-containing protein 15 isoform X2 [Betta splendens]|nr:tudor domain-containing protein 15 isoform X2 [Betta splendens]
MAGAAVRSGLGSDQSHISSASLSGALGSVDLRLTHLDWNPEAALIHFQGKYLTTGEHAYVALQEEIQNEPKTEAEVGFGQLCLVEDLSSGRWYRGRVQNKHGDLLDVYLIDYGYVLSVGVANLSSCSSNVFDLPPKIVCGFLANVILFQGSSQSVVEDFFSSFIGKNVSGCIQAFLHDEEILLLEAPDINSELVKHGFGRYMDFDTFLLLFKILIEIPLEQRIEPVQAGYGDILSFCGPRLCCGTRVKVRVTAAVSPELFYCQMAGAEAELWEMSKKLAQLHTQRTEEDKLGPLCSVKAKDGRWCRGCVQGLPVNSHIRVLFIDYGFSEFVKLEHVHLLPPDFYSPVEVFRCSLSPVNGQDETAKTQQLCFLKAGLLGGVLDVEISSFDEEQHLYSITVFSTEYNNLKESEPIQIHPKVKAEPVAETEELSFPGGNVYEMYMTLMGEALDKTLEAEEVQVGSAFVGFVEYALDPSKFWIRTQKHNDEFEEMTRKLADHFYQVKMDDDILMNPEPGTRCCAMYEKDLHFYRAIVTDILDQGARVLFMDYGNTERVPQMLIKRMPEVFASHAAFAFCCTLSNVFPMDECWTSATSELFRRAVSNKSLLVRVVDKWKTRCVVDLYEMGSDDNCLSIAELLVSSKPSEFWSPPIKSVVQSNKRTSDINATSAISRNKEHREKNKPQRLSFKPLCIKPGFELTVYCSCINSVSDFWCQPLDKRSALEQMMKDLQQYYSAHTVPYQSGEPCCVIKFPGDGRWYRGLITEKERGRVGVLLIDYGFTTHIKEHGLQAMMPQYVDLEVQAFRCSLNGRIDATDPKDCGSSTVNKLLKDFVFNSPHGLKCQVFLQLNVKNRGLCNIVDLCNIQTQQTLTRALVKSGLAKETTISVTANTCPESFIYCSYGLRPGTEEDVYVTHVSSQWEVYCHLERNSEIIKELEKKIPEQSEQVKQSSRSAVGSKLCLAKYLDGKWYRGLAQPVSQSPRHLSVFFVDYGGFSISEKTCVTFLPAASDFLCTPMQAMRCSLAKVSKKELYADAKEWLVKAVLDKQVRAIIVGKSEDGSFDVELFDGDININKKVNELILRLSPKPKTVMTFKASSTNLNQEISPARERRDNTNQNLDRTELSVSTQPLRTCDVKDSGPSVENPEQHSHAVPPRCPLPVRKLNAGFRAKCFTSHIESISSFFLQLSEDEAAILKMVQDLNSDVFKDGLKAATSLGINDLVLAEFQEDGALYRSVVKSYEGSSCLMVDFIDYGNSETVDKAKVYPLPEDYRSQPRLSIPCSLLDTDAYEKAAAFSAAVTEKPLMVEFVRPFGSQWKVKIEILDAAGEMQEEQPVGGTGNYQGGEVCRHAVETQSFRLEAPPVALKVKGRVRTRLRRKSKARRKGSTTNARKAPTVRGDCTEAFVPMTTDAQDSENGTVLSVQSTGKEKSHVGFATAVTTPFKFCVVLEDLLVMKKLNEPPGPMCPLPEAHLIPGTCCLFKSDSENEWCRAEIVSADACLVLNLVDHGVCKLMPSENASVLRRLPEELVDLPKVTYPCSLRGVEPVGGDGRWSNEAALFFQQRLYQKNLHIFFRELMPNSHWKVDIMADGVHVAKDLVDAGHASYLDVILELRFQEQRALPQHVDKGSADDDADLSAQVTEELQSALSTTCLLM